MIFHFHSRWPIIAIQVILEILRLLICKVHHILWHFRGWPWRLLYRVCLPQAFGLDLSKICLLTCHVIGNIAYLYWAGVRSYSSMTEAIERLLSSSLGNWSLSRQYGSNSPMVNIWLLGILHMVSFNNDRWPMLCVFRFVLILYYCHVKIIKITLNKLLLFIEQNRLCIWEAIE